MAGINLNQFNPGALAAVAGNNFPNLNLPVPNYDVSGYGKGLFQGQLGAAQLQQQYDQTAQQAMVDYYKEQQSNMRNQQDNATTLYRGLLSDEASMDRTKYKGDIQIRGQDLTAMHNERRYGVDLAKLQNDNARLGLDERRAGAYERQVGIQEKSAEVNRQKAIHDMAMKEVELLMKKDNKHLKKMGAAAATWTAERAQFNNDPQKQQEFDRQQARLYHEAGIIDDREYGNISKLIEEQPQRVPEALKIAQLNTDAAQKGQLQLGQSVSADPELSKNIRKEDAAQLKDYSKSRTSMDALYNDATNALTSIPKVPSWGLGPIPKAMGIDKLPGEEQNLIQSLNAMALNLKDYYNLGSGQGFTDADRQFLQEIAGSTAYYNKPLTEIVQRIQRIAVAGRYNAWEKENSIRKLDNPMYYNSWLSVNPEPMKLKDFDEQQIISQEYAKIKAKNPNASDEDIMGYLKNKVSTK
jgi:hypothetical protein